MTKNLFSKAGIAAAALSGAAFLAGPAQAATPLGGLTVAVSPAGDKLVVGGDPRTIMVLDPNSLKVLSRNWIGTTIVSMAFNKDGSILAVMDTDATVHLYDPNTWKAKYTLRKHDKMTIHTDKGILAGVNSRYRGGSIEFNSLKDGSNLGKADLGPKERVDAIGFSKDGSKLAVVFDAVKTPDEKKVGYRDIPKDLRGAARDEFRQRNDGRMSSFRVYEVPSGKKLWEGHTYFDLGSRGKITFDGDALVALSYSSYGAKIPKDGNAKMFRTKNSFNYGLDLSPDGSLWLSGGLRRFSLTSTKDLGNKGQGQLRRLPGWPEYFKGFSATANNKTIYATTSAYRIVKLDGTGKIIKVAPVH